MFNIYVLLGLGLANAIYNYLRLKIRVLCVGNFNLKCLLIEFVIPNLSQIIFVYQKSLKRTFKTVFFSAKKPFKFVNLL